MALLIDGKRISAEIKDELKEEWLNFNESVTKFIMECDSHD